LEHARGQLDESLREGHTLHVEIDQLRRNMQVLEVQNKKLRDELAETRAGIAGVMQTLDSLQTGGMEIALDDIDDSQTSAIDILTVGSEI
jgi:regulator of replication initiation timing